jgi:hypothetical protein
MEKYDYHTTNAASTANLHLPSGSHSSPYGSGDPYYNQSTGYVASAPPKRRTSKWIKLGIPIALLLIAGVVVGVVLGIRSSKNKSSSASGNGANAGVGANEIGRFPVSTDTNYFMPVYPSTVRFSCCGVLVY